MIHHEIYKSKIYKKEFQFKLNMLNIIIIKKECKCLTCNIKIYYILKVVC